MKALQECLNLIRGGRSALINAKEREGKNKLEDSKKEGKGVVGMSEKFDYPTLKFPQRLYLSFLFLVRQSLQT